VKKSFLAEKEFCKIDPWRRSPVRPRTPGKKADIERLLSSTEKSLSEKFSTEFLKKTFFENFFPLKIPLYEIIFKVKISVEFVLEFYSENINEKSAPGAVTIIAMTMVPVAMPFRQT
jgi:hypothetical protein